MKPGWWRNSTPGCMPSKGPVYTGEGAEWRWWVKVNVLVTVLLGGCIIVMTSPDAWQWFGENLLPPALSVAVALLTCETLLFWRRDPYVFTLGWSPERRLPMIRLRVPWQPAPAWLKWTAGFIVLLGAVGSGICLGSLAGILLLDQFGLHSGGSVLLWLLLGATGGTWLYSVAAGTVLHLGAACVRPTPRAAVAAVNDPSQQPSAGERHAFVDP